MALSGHGMDADIRASHAAGFRTHLVKPVEFSKLEAALRRVVME